MGTRETERNPPNINCNPPPEVNIKHRGRERQREYWTSVKDEGGHLPRIVDVGGREPKRYEENRTVDPPHNAI